MTLNALKNLVARDIGARPGCNDSYCFLEAVYFERLKHLSKATRYRRLLRHFLSLYQLEIIFRLARP